MDAVLSAPWLRDAGGRHAACPAGPSPTSGSAGFTGAKASVGTAIALCPRLPRVDTGSQKLLTIGAAVDSLLLNRIRASDPNAVWQELEPVAHQVGPHFQAFQRATMRVCERLNIPQNEG